MVETFREPPYRVIRYSPTDWGIGKGRLDIYRNSHEEIVREVCRCINEAHACGVALGQASVCTPPAKEPRDGE